MTDLTIEREILIEAPADVVWRTITEPDQIVQWFADRVQLDLRPGGAGTFVFENRATSSEVTAPLVVEAVEPPQRFAFRWSHPEGQSPVAGNSMLVEFLLTAEGNERTRLPSWRAASTRLMVRCREGQLRRGPPPRLVGAHQAARRPARRRRGMIRDDDELWSAIADPSRRRVLDLLVRAGAASASLRSRDEVPSHGGSDEASRGARTRTRDPQPPRPRGALCRRSATPRRSDAAP